MIVAAFLICGGSEFQTEGPKMTEGTTTILQMRGIKRTSVFRLPECLTAGPDRLTFHAATVHVGLTDGKGQDERMSRQDPNTYTAQKNAVYLDETQHTNFRGNPL